MALHYVSQFLLKGKGILSEQISQSDPLSGRFAGIAWANAFLGGAQGKDARSGLRSLTFLKAIHTL